MKWLEGSHEQKDFQMDNKIQLKGLSSEYQCTKIPQSRRMFTTMHWKETSYHICPEYFHNYLVIEHDTQ